MRRLSALLLALLVSLAGVGPRALAAAGAGNPAEASAQPTASSEANLATDFYTVLLDEGQLISLGLLAAVEQAGGQIINQLPELGALGVRSAAPLSLPEGQVSLAGLQGPALVKQVAYPAEAPLPEPWQLQQLRGAPLAGKQKTALALIDSGLNGRHNDLIASFTKGVNLVPAGGLTGNDETETGHALDVKDRLGSGSLAAGVAAGAGLTRGVAPGLPLTVYRVFDQGGVAPTIWFAEGLVKAVDDGAKVVALNLGDLAYLPALDRELLKRAFAYAAANDVLVVLPAGHGGQDLRRQADLAELLAPALVVAPLGPDETIASYSNFGLTDLVAPGGDLRLDDQLLVGPAPEGLGYVGGAGAGLAASQVAAVAAWLRDANPAWSAPETKAALLKTARPLSKSKTFFGWGVLDPAGLRGLELTP